MDIKDKVVIVTGRRLGHRPRAVRALCAGRRARRGRRRPRRAPARRRWPPRSAAWRVRVNVADEAEVQRLVQTATERFGQVDLFCSNAGVIVRADEDASQRRTGSATGTST